MLRNMLLRHVDVSYSLSVPVHISIHLTYVLQGKDALNDPANCPAYHTDDLMLLNHVRSSEATLGALARAFLPPVAVTLGASVVLGE